MIRDQQTALLEKFADREGLWLDIEKLGPKHSGRMEHAVFESPQDRTRVFKVTKGPKFGFFPSCPHNIVSARVEDLIEMRPATPAQYLARLEVWDEIAPGINRFEGFTHLDGHFSIVTSQIWYEARNSTWTEIIAWFRALGFVPVRSDVFEEPVRWFHPRQNLAVFDIGQSNILWCDGALMPIDIIPMRPDEHMRGILLEALHIGE